MAKPNLTIDERLKLVLSVGEEVVGADELKPILESGEDLVCYDGFEPSGQMHIAQGIMRAISTNKMTKAGFKFVFYVADWFAYLNKKMGGDIEKIRTVGRYFIELWKASGMDLSNVSFVWASAHAKDPLYWELVMKVAQNTTLNRILRTTQIMGRSESDKLMASQIFYPCMQAADIFKLNARVTQLGMDQRKVNMLARQVGPELGFFKPIVISNHMLMGLGKPAADNMDAIERAIAMKMSKSIPDSAIFMTDTKEDVERKIMNAYCAEGDIKDNPILEYCKYIIFEAYHLVGFEDLLAAGFVVERPEKYGGDVVYKTYDELEKAFSQKELFPTDLKAAVIGYINKLLDPVREHFEKDHDAKALLEMTKSYQVTR
ncbi:tyrosine--tRNA ligase [Candidatus Dojkabacteria bacterium]|nr:tyrosine--tRNA ligase [Candidatus Dojkabacteria bacterium]